MDTRINLFKTIIVIFLILNISVLGFGYVIIDNKFQDNKLYLSKTTSQYLRKEESLLENIDILSKSKEDLNSKLNALEVKTLHLTEKLNLSLSNFNSIESEKTYLKNKLSIENQKNSLLLQNKQTLSIKLENQKIAEQKAAAIVFKRKTRSS